MQPDRERFGKRSYQNLHQGLESSRQLPAMHVDEPGNIDIKQLRKMINNNKNLLVKFKVTIRIGLVETAPIF